MPLSQASLAAAVGAGAKNVQFLSEALNVPRKILVIATYDVSKTTIADEVPEISLGPADAGDKYGFGSIIHRLVLAAEAGSQGVETWVCPQAEAGGAVAASGDVDFITSAVTEAGPLPLYIGGDPVFVSLVVGDGGVEIVTKIVAKMAELKELPLAGSVGTPTTTLDLDAKSKGPWGNTISITFAEGFQEKLPAGVVAVVTDMAAGAGIPDIQDALDGLGLADNANELQFTDGVQGYGIDTTTLNALSTWNGVGNDFLGLYKKTLARPIRFLNGDTDDAGFSTLLALGNGRKTDRTNGIVGVPGSPSTPAEIAAKAIGIMARLNNNRAAENYVGQILPDVIPGPNDDRWTDDYDNRDTAVKAGISPSMVEGGAVVLQDVLSYYHPDAIAVSSNGFRSMRNISIIQNIQDAVKSNFRQDKWKGISIVADVNKVTNVTDRQKARNINAVLDDLMALTISFESHAWIFSASFTIDRLKSGNLIQIRPGGRGFNSRLPVLFSGEGTILDTVTEFDVSLAVIL